jgi:hypothetical protein
MKKFLELQREGCELVSGTAQRAGFGFECVDEAVTTPLAAGEDLHLEGQQLRVRDAVSVTIANDTQDDPDDVLG